MPIIDPSFDEATARVVDSNEAARTNQEVDQSSQETSESSSSTTKNPDNPSEYVNPRGIRFTTSASTATLTVPAKGMSFVIHTHIDLET